MGSIIQLLFILGISLCFCKEVIGQYASPAIPAAYNSDTVKIVPATVFPLGALLTGDATTYLDSLKKLSINTTTNFIDGGGQDNVAKTDTLGWVGGGSGWIPGFFDHQEQRNYLFSGYNKIGSKGILERQLDYAVESGAFYSKAGSLIGTTNTGQEWRIDTSEVLDRQTDKDNDTLGYAGNYLLRFPLGQPLDKFDAKSVNYAHYFDFMYHFADSNLFTVSNPSTPLFTIEIWIRGAKTHSKYNTGDKWRKYDTILTYDITKQKYLDALSSSHDSSWWANDLEHSLRIAPNGDSTVRMHIALDSGFLHHYFTDGTTGDSSSYLRSKFPGELCFGNCDMNSNGDWRNFIRFDVRVRRNPALKIPIFVKGLRIRNGGAEKLLTGGYDSLLAFRFKMISQSKYLVYNDTTKIHDTLTGSYYPNLLNLQSENEPYPDRYYIIGYLDRFARDSNDPNGHPFRRFTAFSPWNPREIRLIWDDILWKPTLTDAAPEHLYRNIEYSAGTSIHLPLPRDMFPKILPARLDLYTQPIMDRTDVVMYEHLHDSLFSNQFIGLLKEVNQGAVAIGTKPVPYWVMGQAYTGLVYKNLDGSTNNGVLPGRLPTGMGYLVDTIRAILSRSSTTDCTPLDRVWNGTLIYDTARTTYDRSNVTAEQIRLQANICAAYGAKGFTVSNAGTNGLREYGFTGNNFDHSIDIYDSSKGIIKGFMDLSDSLYYAVKLKSGGTWFFTKSDTFDLSTYEYWTTTACDPKPHRAKFIPFHDPNTSGLWCINDCSATLTFES